MANQQQEENIRLQEAKKLIQDINSLRVQMNQEPLKLGDAEAVKGIQSLRNEFKQLARDIGDVDNSASNLFEQMVGIAKEFGAVSTPANQLKSAFKGIVAEAAKLKNDELGLLDLRTRDLESIEKKLGLQYEAARVAASQFTGQEALIKKAEKAREEETKQRNHINKLKQAAIDLEAQGNDDGALVKLASVERYEKQIVGVQRSRATLEKAIKPEAKAALAFLNDQKSAYTKIQDKVKERKGTEKEITRLSGVTGALVGGTGALMERLGMRSGIFHDAMKDSAEDMRAMAKSTAEGGKQFTKLQIAATGFSTLAKGFSGALKDPAAAALAIVTAFLDVNKAAVEFTQYTGQAAASLGGVNTEVASMTDMLKTAVELTKQTGLNAATVFTSQQIGQIADAQQLLGVSAEQAGKLGMMMKLTSKSADEIGNAIYDNVDAGISNKVVYDDVLSASDDITASVGGNAKALAGAASAARKIGLELSKVNSIADGLLDFESSIEAELEAQLLTGKSINLNKAREFALNNDLEGLAKELSKNGASAAEYAKMNRIEQQALAKALGMSRQELGTMVLTEEAIASMTEEQVAAARGVTLEQSKQMDIQAKIQKSLDRLAQAFAPILEAIVPIVDVLLNIIRPIAAGVGWLLKWKAVSYPLVAIFGAIAVSMAAMKIASFAGAGVKGFQAMRTSLTGLQQGLKGIPGLLKGAGGALGKLRDGLVGEFKAVTTPAAPEGGIVEDLQDRAKGKLGDKAENAATGAAGTSEPKSSGVKIKEFLTNLAAGLKEMASMKVVQGALALIPAAIGLVAMIPGYLGAKLLEKISGPKLLLAFQSLSQGLSSMSKTFIGSLALAAAAAAFMLMIPGSAGMALMGLTAPMAAAGIYILIPALEALGAAMMTGVGALGLAALVGMAVGLGASFALIGAGAMMFGLGIKYAAEGISTIFSGLTGLISAIPQLYLIGGALMSIAGGLGAIAFAGFAAIPALSALSGLIIMATPLLAVAGLFGGDEGEGSSDSFAKLEAKLDILISAVQAGGNVYLDGNKVGSALTIGSYKSS